MYSWFCLLYWGQLTSPGPLGELGMSVQRRSSVYVPCDFILQKYHHFICIRQLHSCVPLWVASFKYFLLQPANLLQSPVSHSQLILIKLITYCNNSCQAFGSGSWCAGRRKAEIRYVSYIPKEKPHGGNRDQTRGLISAVIDLTCDLFPLTNVQPLGVVFGSDANLNLTHKPRQVVSNSKQICWGQSRVIFSVSTIPYIISPVSVATSW